jgi:uncharacterized protein (TIGR02246 family)
VDDEIGWLLDRAKIQELTARYNRSFDDGDPEAYALTFTEDGSMSVVGGPSTTGRAALAEMCRNVPWGVMHVTVDPTVTIDGDTATQVVTLLVFSRPSGPGEKARVSSTARYVDTVVRTADGWLFSNRVCTIDGWPKP